MVRIIANSHLYYNESTDFYYTHKINTHFSNTLFRYFRLAVNSLQGNIKQLRLFTFKEYASFSIYENMKTNKTFTQSFLETFKLNFFSKSGCPHLQINVQRNSNPDNSYVMYDNLQISKSKQSIYIHLYPNDILRLHYVSPTIHLNNEPLTYKISKNQKNIDLFTKTKIELKCIIHVLYGTLDNIIAEHYSDNNAFIEYLNLGYHNTTVTKNINSPYISPTFHSYTNNYILFKVKNNKKNTKINSTLQTFKYYINYHNSQTITFNVQSNTQLSFQIKSLNVHDFFTLIDLHSKKNVLFSNHNIRSNSITNKFQFFYTSFNIIPHKIYLLLFSNPNTTIISDLPENWSQNKNLKSSYYITVNSHHSTHLFNNIIISSL